MSHSFIVIFWPRLPMIHLEKRSMHLNSILKTFCVHPHHTSSIPFMIPSEKEQIMFVDTLLVFVKVLQLQFLMVFGSTSQTMMLLHNLWSLLRGTLGIYVLYNTPILLFWTFCKVFGLYNFDCDSCHCVQGMWMLF